jgi:hypothetical protein
MSEQPEDFRAIYLASLEGKERLSAEVEMQYTQEILASEKLLGDRLKGRAEVSGDLSGISFKTLQANNGYILEAVDTRDTADKDWESARFSFYHDPIMNPEGFMFGVDTPYALHLSGKNDAGYQVDQTYLFNSPDVGENKKVVGVKDKNGVSVIKGFPIDLRSKDFERAAQALTTLKSGLEEIS